LTDNYAASGLTVTPASSVLSNPADLDGDYSVNYAGFRGPLVGTVYTTLGWNFAGDWDFDYYPDYPYPVLSWQTSAPAAGPTTLP
jgi:hypothetical protein